MQVQPSGVRLSMPLHARRCIYMYIAIVLVLLMEHQLEMGIWGPVGLWLDWFTPGGKREEGLRNCLYVALVELF